MPTALARSVPVTAATVLLPVVMVGLFGSLFTATFHLQDTLRPDPLTTGLRVLPLTVLRVIGSPPAGAALGRWGRARPRSPAPLLVVLGTVGTLLLLAGITALSLGPALLLPSVRGRGVSGVLAPSATGCPLTCRCPCGVCGRSEPRQGVATGKAGGFTRGQRRISVRR
ncbi:MULTISPECIES: hypothetical protein [unclassified Streptomyces]|uniref:hypothetical protein n=1 Tax=unclassified Streptomyces TaxID=2593676 RepID=UPI0003A942F5|nr:hypothetical protein [Streptomyces sp. LaPpAH-202]